MHDSKAIYKHLNESLESTTDSSKHSVPSECTLFGHTIRTIIDPRPNNVEKWGVADYNKNTITLYTEDCEPSVVHHSYYHELAHFLLVYSGRSDLSTEEDFVDVLGGLLAQFDVTRRP